MTGLQAIYRALRVLKVLNEGQTASTEDNADGLAMLNAMLQQMSADQLMVYSVTTAAYDLTTATGAYNIATGQSSPHINAARPVKIEDAAILTENHLASGKKIRSRLEIVRFAEFRKEADRGATATAPSKLYYDPASPTGVVHLWPVPTFTGTPVPQLELTAWAQLATFSSTATDNTFPPGYDDAIVHGLAEKLAPMYVGQVPADTARQAAAGRQIIAQRNAELFGIELPKAA